MSATRDTTDLKPKKWITGDTEQRRRIKALLLAVSADAVDAEGATKAHLCVAVKSLEAAYHAAPRSSK